MRPHLERTIGRILADSVEDDDAAPPDGHEARQSVDQLAPVGEVTGVQDVVPVEEVEHVLQDARPVASVTAASPRPPRCRATSKARRPAAALTFSESTWPASGTLKASSQTRHAGPSPLPSAPNTSATPVASGEVRLPHRDLGAAVRVAQTQSCGPLISSVPREVDATTATGRCSTAPAEALQTAAVTRAAFRSVIDPVRPGPLGAANDRAEIVRVGDLVEAHQQWALADDELVGIGITVGLAEGDDALVLRRACSFVQPSLGDDLKPEAGDIPETRLGGERALGDEELEVWRFPARTTSRTGCLP